MFALNWMPPGDCGVLEPLAGETLSHVPESTLAVQFNVPEPGLVTSTPCEAKPIPPCDALKNNPVCPRTSTGADDETVKRTVTTNAPGLMVIEPV